MSEVNPDQPTAESTAAERQKQLLKREHLKMTNPSYLLYRELAKHLYAYGVVRRLDRPEAQFQYINGLPALIRRANYPANTDRLTATTENNPGGMEGEALALLQSLGVLDDIPLDVDAIWDYRHDPENQFHRLRNFPEAEQRLLEEKLKSKINSLSILMVLRDITTHKPLKYISGRIGECGEYSQEILELLYSSKIVTLKDISRNPELHGPHYLLEKILPTPDEARSEFFRVLHSHPDIYLPPHITFIPITKPT